MILSKKSKSTPHIIGSMDVSSLYTNIPNDEGIASSLKFLIENRGNGEKPTPEALGSLLNLVLKCSNFQFNGKNFLQVGGTAMGTRVAPSYANLFITKLEEEILYNCNH